MPATRLFRWYNSNFVQVISLLPFLSRNKSNSKSSSNDNSSWMRVLPLTWKYRIQNQNTMHNHMMNTVLFSLQLDYYLHFFFSVLFRSVPCCPELIISRIIDLIVSVTLKSHGTRYLSIDMMKIHQNRTENVINHKSTARGIKISSSLQ